MIKQLYTLPKFKQYLYSLLISILGMSAAVACSSFYCLFFEETAVNMALIFILFLILISCNTTGYFYGILCSGFIILWFNYRFTYPFHFLDFPRKGYPMTFLFMSIITVLISLLSSRIALHYRFLLEKERVLAGAEMERMRANLLRAVSHDLRTPLTTIYGASTTLLENGENFSPEQQRALLQGIQEDSEWLTRMVENLLSITRIDSGKIKIIKTPTVLDELIDSVMLKFRKRYPGQEVSLELPEEIVVIPMDATLIEQVLINLLENAVLHAQGMTELSLQVFTLGNQAIFEIRDNGCGIDEERLKHIFSGYMEAADNTSDSQKRNSGIGLSVCATIIRAHGGDISAVNRKSGGSCFRFTLNIEEGTEHDEQ